MITENYNHLNSIKVKSVQTQEKNFTNSDLEFKNNWIKI
jgi:hypothetical protein